MRKTGPAHLEITRVFEIPDRGVVLAGQMRAGVARAGMQAHLPLNGSLSVAVTVKSVEFVDNPSGLADVGLVLDEETPALRALWVQAISAGEVICLFDASGA